MKEALRIVVVAPELVTLDEHDSDAIAQAERSRSLRIGLLESGFNLVAVLPAEGGGSVIASADPVGQVWLYGEPPLYRIQSAVKKRLLEVLEEL